MTRVIDHIYQLKAANPTAPFCAFLYDLRRLQDHARQWKAGLPPQCRFFYAIKANSAAPLLKALAPIVDGFETASIGEVRQVRAVDPAIPIIFGGPGKTNDELEGAIDHGVSLIHVESLHEIDRLAWIAGRRAVAVPILLRVNLRGPLPAGTLQMAGEPTQFGVDEADLDAAIARIKQYPQLILQGFHLHSLSNNLDAESHARLMAYYLRRFADWRERYGEDFVFLNAGGGIGVNYQHPDQQFDAVAFASRLRDALSHSKAHSPQAMIFECGRYTVASCGYYAAEVLDIRQRDDTAFVIIAGGLHHFLLPGAWKHNHPFEIVPVEPWRHPFPRPAVRNTPITIAGKMNSPRDILARQVLAPEVRAGDILLFTCAGAYGWAISAHSFSSLEHPRHIFMD